MRSYELIRLVCLNMLQNRAKVLLTSLGIIVGTITVVLVIAIGQGAEQEAAAQYSALSADTIYINPNYGTLGPNADLSRIEKLSPELLEHIIDESSALAGAYLRADIFKEAKVNGKKSSFPVIGVTTGYDFISNLYVQLGADLTQDDIEGSRRVALMGSKLAEKLFSSQEMALGNFIKLGNYQYKIVGVLRQTGDGLQGMNADESVLIPYTTLRDDRQLDSFTVPVAVCKARSLALVPLAMAEIRSTLRYYMENSASYKLDDAGSRIEAATESARTMKMLLLSVAIIVFIVGGIGIMNVLFVTVKERTREIGIMKALGNTDGDILKQFLLESASIGVFGGLSGLLISSVILRYVTVPDLPMIPSGFGMLLALSFAVLTSTVFGFYPAYRASKLLPVDALNQE